MEWILELFIVHRSQFQLECIPGTLKSCGMVCRFISNRWASLAPPRRTAENVALKPLRCVSFPPGLQASRSYTELPHVVSPSEWGGESFVMLSRCPCKDSSLSILRGFSPESSVNSSEDVFFSSLVFPVQTLPFCFLMTLLRCGRCLWSRQIGSTQYTIWTPLWGRPCIPHWVICRSCWLIYSLCDRSSSLPPVFSLECISHFLDICSYEWNHTTRTFSGLACFNKHK